MQHNKRSLLLSKDMSLIYIFKNVFRIPEWEKNIYCEFFLTVPKIKKISLRWTTIFHYLQQFWLNPRGQSINRVSSINIRRQLSSWRDTVWRNQSIATTMCTAHNKIMTWAIFNRNKQQWFAEFTSFKFSITDVKVFH